MYNFMYVDEMKIHFPMTVRSQLIFFLLLTNEQPKKCLVFPALEKWSAPIASSGRIYNFFYTERTWTLTKKSKNVFSCCLLSSKASCCFISGFYLHFNKYTTKFNNIQCGSLVINKKWFPFLEEYLST